MKYCTTCGSANPDDAKFCQNCGTPIEIANVGGEPVVTTTAGAIPGTTPEAPPGEMPLNAPGYYGNVPPEVAAQSKSEVLALILSLIIPGAGEIYVGKVSKGIVLIILAVLTFFTIILYIPVWIYAMIDSYNLAKKYNQLLYQTGIPPDPSLL